MRTAIPALTWSIALAGSIAVAGCSGEQVRRATYEAGMQKQCEKDTGVPGCATPKPSYDDYRHERDKTLSQ